MLDDFYLISGDRTIGAVQLSTVINVFVISPTSTNCKLLIIIMYTCDKIKINHIYCVNGNFTYVQYREWKILPIVFQSFNNHLPNRSMENVKRTLIARLIQIFRNINLIGGSVIKLIAVKMIENWWFQYWYLNMFYFLFHLNCNIISFDDASIHLFLFTFFFNSTLPFIAAILKNFNISR